VPRPERERGHELAIADCEGRVDPLVAEGWESAAGGRAGERPRPAGSDRAGPLPDPGVGGRDGGRGPGDAGPGRSLPLSGAARRPGGIAGAAGDVDADCAETMPATPRVGEPG